jgi:hypothetical protein
MTADPSNAGHDRYKAARHLAVGVVLLILVVLATGMMTRSPRTDAAKPAIPHTKPRINYRPKQMLDMSGFVTLVPTVKPWPPSATLEEVAAHWERVGYRNAEEIDRHLAQADLPARIRATELLRKAMLLNYEGETLKAYDTLRETREIAEANDALAAASLYSIIYAQGVTALRRGEDENCVMCRGESSCILPIAPAAVHTNPAGSRLAIGHFTEYLKRFPDDLEVRWLLNLAHMTLGEYPQNVNPRYLITLDRYTKSEFDIGRFRDIGHLVGINRLNQSGGAIMDDFDNDGRLDVVLSSLDPTASLAFFWNKGDGTFEDRSQAAGVSSQLGGLNCVQTDYNNDGWLDIFTPRGAWLPFGIRPSLLRNEGDGRFKDVTVEAGLLDPVNSNSAQWADYDNDGWLDVFISCEQQPNRLYHNKGDGTFEEVAGKAGVQGESKACCKGAAWIDYDNDGFPDLFANNLGKPAKLYRNNRDGSFTDVSESLGIDGPEHGFSCWAWDYDNDGWLDIFATCFDRTLEDVVKGLIGQPHSRTPNKLFHNKKGQGFEDDTEKAGLNMVFSAMGSNHGDLDNDGFLDMYLGTGEPSIATLVPNRMFKNVGGTRFSEITASSGTGHLQKGHGVAIGDWDRDGDLDILIDLGGATNGDRYHNALFQNPGQKNHWLNVKLVGKKTNRAAIGARIKVVTAGKEPLTIERHVSTGSSFGANPLEQMIGVAGADKIDVLEIHWPTSGTTQVFRDIGANQAIEITEFAKHYQLRKWESIRLPK